MYRFRYSLLSFAEGNFQLHPAVFAMAEFRDLKQQQQQQQKIYNIIYLTQPQTKINLKQTFS